MDTHLLQTVFDHTFPKYTSFQFAEMINVGLVLQGVKKGALLKLDDYAIHWLQKHGLYVEKYPLLDVPNLVFVSKRDPKWRKDVNHVDVGRALSYLTPIDITDDFKHFLGVRIEVTFRRNKGRVLKAYLMTQKIVGKTKTEAMDYLKPFTAAIQTMNIPKGFTILNIEGIVEKY
jgi:hypothetical protein